MKNISFLIILIGISIKINSQEIFFDKELNLKSDFLSYTKNQSLSASASVPLVTKPNKKNKEKGYGNDC